MSLTTPTFTNSAAARCVPNATRDVPQNRHSILLYRRTISGEVVALEVLQRVAWSTSASS